MKQTLGLRETKNKTPDSLEVESMCAWGVFCMFHSIFSKTKGMLNRCSMKVRKSQFYLVEKAQLLQRKLGKNPGLNRPQTHDHAIVHFIVSVLSYQAFE